MEDAVVEAIRDCKTDVQQITDIGWTGVGLWVIHAWVRDYIIRAQKLVLCGFRNNLNSKFDAEWYISVLQPNLAGVIAQSGRYAIYNPLAYIFLGIFTATIWIWVLILLGIIESIVRAWEMEAWCDDLAYTFLKLQLVGDGTKWG